MGRRTQHWVYAPPPVPWSPADPTRPPAPAPVVVVPVWLPHAGPPQPARRGLGAGRVVWIVLAVLVGWPAALLLIAVLISQSWWIAPAACGVALALAMCRPRGRFFARRGGIRR